MHQPRISRLALLCAPLIAAAVFAPIVQARIALPVAQPTTFSCSGWVPVPSPSAGVDANLAAVAGDGPGDLWAVGSYYKSDPTSDLLLTLTEHWNGTSWSVLPSPNVPSINSSLSAVAVLSPADAWAVGGSGFGAFDSLQTLIEHWNGTSWSIVASPNVGSDTNVLWSVEAAASNDVWAVGNAGSGGVGQTLIEHWNGTSWSLVPGANPNPQSSLLYGVAALAGAGQPWAVGNLGTASGYAPLTERWNGSAWANVRAPAPATFAGLNGVVVIAHPGTRSGADVWAVGVANGSTPQTSGALIMRYQPLALGLLCPAL